MDNITIERARQAKFLIKEKLNKTPIIEIVGIGINKINEDYAVKIKNANFDKLIANMNFYGVPIILEVVGKVCSL